MLIESDFCNWTIDYDKSIKHILSLQPGWYGKISQVPSQKSIQLAGIIFKELQKDHSQMPDGATPIFYGGIEMSWILKNGRLVVNIDDNPVEQIILKYDSRISIDHSMTGFQFDQIESVVFDIKTEMIKNN